MACEEANLELFKKQLKQRNALARVYVDPYDKRCQFRTGEPGKPGKPVIDDYDNTMVKLKWTKPESDGGRPITHYVIEMKDKFSDWSEVRPGRTVQMCEV